MDAQLILLIAGCLALLIQLVYTWVIFGRIAFYNDVFETDPHEPPVSIIMAARNESANLQQNLVHFLEQDYPEFEVIVVNDCSWDDSQQILEEMQTRYKHLKVSRLIEQEKYPTGKKFALTLGIKAARYEKMLFTDADCVPAGNQWLRLMQRRLTGKKELVLGYAPHFRSKGFLNLFVRFETLMTSLFCFGLAIRGNAFMGVGRNLGYTRNLFFRHKGFASHQHILSGDDDLFVNETATSANVNLELHPDTFVYTEAKKDFASFRHQKIRHMMTGKYYRTKHQAILGLYYLSHLFFYILLITSLILFPNSWPWVVAMYGARLLSQFVVYYYAAHRLKCTQVVFFLPLLDLVYVLFVYYFGTIGFFRKKLRKW